jgi:hypothetical protein
LVAVGLRAAQWIAAISLVQRDGNPMQFSKGIFYPKTEGRLFPAHANGSPNTCYLRHSRAMKSASNLSITKFVYVPLFKNGNKTAEGQGSCVAQIHTLPG